MSKSFLTIIILSCTFMMGSSSCSTSPILPTRTPLEANKYELPFQFKCDDKDVNVFGIGYCQYKVGDKMSIKIKTPALDGEIQVRSCRHSRAMDIDSSKGWQNVEWIQFTIEDSCPIVISVTTQDTGTQVGTIYPYIYDSNYIKMTATTKLYCFESENIKEIIGQGSCQFPTGIKVRGHLFLDPLKDGEYLIVSPCGLSRKEIFSKGTSYVEWMLSSDVTAFCPVSSFIKYKDGVKEENEIYLSYFDTRYRALPPPILSQDDGDSYACAPQDYEYIDLNDHNKQSGWLKGKCLSDGWINGAATAIAWDRAGRISYSTIKKKE